MIKMQKKKFYLLIVLMLFLPVLLSFLDQIDEKHLGAYTPLDDLNTSYDPVTLEWARIYDDPATSPDQAYIPYLDE